MTSDQEPPPRTLGLVYDPVFKQHVPGQGHPERPERHDAAVAGVAEAGTEQTVVELPIRAASDAELALTHTADYIKLAKAEIRDGRWQLSTGDTAVSSGTLEAATKAVGSVLEAVDAVAAGTVTTAFCAVRPPGHHATPARGMGFCVFNNVAIAARHAQTRHGAERILIVDWDVHHGNGTQDAFYSDPAVFYFSTHQWPFYPGTGHGSETGTGEGQGATLNCPFPGGTTGQQLAAAFRDRLVPAMQEFRPEFVLISAGFDALRQDPIGGMLLDPDDYAELTRIVMGIAAEHADGRIVSVLEGGYHLMGLMAAVSAHVKTLLT